MGKSGGVLNIVTTFDGSSAFKNNCKHIGGRYYEMNRQCFMMDNGKWNRIDNGKIAYDHTYKRWVFLSSPGLVKGIIGVKPNNDFELGYFTKKGHVEAVGSNDGNLYVMNQDLIIDHPQIVEAPSDGKLYMKDFYIRHPSLGRKRVYSYRNYTLDYSAQYHLQRFVRHYKQRIKDRPLPTPSNLHYKELGNIKFGFEFETWNGTIPERMIEDLGLIPLRDGSLNHDGYRSYEYATIPLSGKNGLQMLKEACKALTTYTEISPMCSMHVHISGYPRTKAFCSKLYLVGLAIQEEIFSLFPAIFEDTTSLKGKSYCGGHPYLMDTKVLLAKPESAVNVVFKALYDYLLSINPQDYPFVDFGVTNHPLDNGDAHKWNIPGRYTWLNFVPFIWTSRGTIEFRVHPPTTNITRSTNWLYLINAIMKFADAIPIQEILLEMNQESISLSRILSFSYGKQVAEYLTVYIHELKKQRKIMDSVNDNTGLAWCYEDANYEFTYGSMKGLI